MRKLTGLCCALFAAVIVPGRAAAQSVVKEMSFPGSLCQIVSGPGTYESGGVVAPAGSISFITVHGPIVRKNEIFAPSLIEVVVQDLDELRKASCSFVNVGTDAAGAVEVRKSPVSSTAGGSAVPQLLQLSTSGSGYAMPDLPMYIECTLSSRVNPITLLNYNVKVLD